MGVNTQKKNALRPIPIFNYEFITVALENEYQKTYS